MTAGEIALVVTAVAVSGTVQLAAGFGFALASVPLLSIVLSPHDAVIVALLLATFTNGYQAFTGWSLADRAVLSRLLGGAVVGLPFGLLVYRAADERVLGVLVGLAVLASVAVIARGLDLRHAGPALDVAGGAVSGALTMSVGTNGPPLVFVLQARHFPLERFRATITAAFFVLDVIAVSVFASTGEFGRDILVAALVAAPGLALGAAVGTWARRFLHAERFRRLVLVLLVVAGISAIATALAQ